MSHTDDVLREARYCPFCGNPYAEELNMTAGSQSDENGGGLWDFYNVFCDCGATGPHGETPEHAVEMWNERASFRSLAHVLIHHVGGDGKAEICGIYTSEAAAASHCIDDSWGYFSVELDAQPMPPDKVIPTTYIYPRRYPPAWTFDENGWREELATGQRVIVDKRGGKR